MKLAYVVLRKVTAHAEYGSCLIIQSVIAWVMVWITVHEQVLTIIVLHLEPYNCTKPHKKFSQVKSIKFQVSPVETLPFLTRGRQLEINSHLVPHYWNISKTTHGENVLVNLKKKGGGLLKNTETNWKNCVCLQS